MRESRETASRTENRRTSPGEVRLSTPRVPRSAFRASSTSAFTTIELLVVIIIAFLVLALLGVAWRNLDARNRRSTAQTQLAYLQSALQDYRHETGSYPSTLADVRERLPRSFTAFTNDIPLDPWGTGYCFIPGTNSIIYTLLSCGPDGDPASTDDNIILGPF